MRNMVNAGYLTEEKYNKYKNIPIELGSDHIGGYSTIAPHFMEYVRRQMENMSDRYGYDLYRDGLNIYTTLDARMQRIANKAAADHLKDYQKLFNKAWNWRTRRDILNAILNKTIHSDARYISADNDKERSAVYSKLKSDKKYVDSVKQVAETIEVGFVAIDPTNGYIKAMIGGENQNFQYGLNHVTGIKRQPGSAFKPITDCIRHFRYSINPLILMVGLLLMQTIVPGVMLCCVMH